jgi:sialate O-acetylesterase
MIQDWRQRWGEGDFPFLFVQLASFNAGGGNSEKGSGWAELREAQTMTLSLPATGMAVTSDIGEPTDIHPRNKQDVGLRLAAEAMRVAYDSAGKAGTQSRGPMFDKMTVSNGQVMLSFKNAASGLMTKDKYGYVRGFEVAGADQQFHFAKAEIRGDAVIVHADAVTTPVAVRYGWADDNSEANLYNKAGFPAVPFRTDTWKGITENGRFTGQ